MVLPTKNGLNSAIELAVAKDQRKECWEQFLQVGVVLYNSAINKVLDKLEDTRSVVIKKNIFSMDGINHCKVSFKENGLDHYYDYSSQEHTNSPLVIEKGKSTETYSIGKAVKFTKDTSGDLTPISGCKYVIADLQPSTERAIDVTKFKVYELNDLQIELIMMNNTLSQAIKVPNTEPEYLVCLYDFPEKPHNNLFIFQPKFSDAVKCFNTLEKAGYYIWDTKQNKVAEQWDIQLAKIECGTICKTTYWGDTYVDWCKQSFKAAGFHHYYEFNTANPKPLKIHGGSKTDTYAIGSVEQRVNGVTKIDGCKYILTEFNQTMKHVIDLSKLKVKFEDLFFKAIYMNDIQSVAVHVDNIQPTYLFCLYDYSDELVTDNFIFSQSAKSTVGEL